MSVAEEHNIMARLRQAILDLINRHKKLPRFILIIIDKDFTKMGTSAEAYKKLLNWLMVEICGMIQTHKGQLLFECYRKSEPKVISTKPGVKYELMDVDHIHREMCRQFNRSLEKCVKKFRYIYATNVDDVIPNDASLFELLAGSLTLKGYEVFWNCIDAAIKKIDASEMKQHKQNKQNRKEVKPQQKRSSVAPLPRKRSTYPSHSSSTAKKDPQWGQRKQPYYSQQVHSQPFKVQQNQIPIQQLPQMGYHNQQM